MDDWQNGGFGLYLHWPFCQAKCPYCDFNSHVVAQIDQAAWRDAYLREIDRYAAMLPDRILGSIYFGGGTPSLMAPDLVDAILQRIRGAWRCTNDLEITLEANPTSVEAGRFQGYRAAGVNRVSLGVQALRDRDLRALGRLHSAADARKAFDIARDTFERVSFDLIYARQDQSLADWTAELTEALSMAADHLSLYQLTIEDGTAFADRHRAGKLAGLPSEDLAVDLYEVTQDLCGAAGLPAYEVSNHAALGAESRHNCLYWWGGDYVGIGPGAHGRLTLNGVRWATEAKAAPRTWLSDVSRETSPEMPREALDPASHGDELLMMGLRLSEGVDLDRIERMRGTALPSQPLTTLIDENLLVLEEGRLRTTPQGRLVLNAILRDLLT